MIISVKTSTKKTVLTKKTQNMTKLDEAHKHLQNNFMFFKKEEQDKNPDADQKEISEKWKALPEDQKEAVSPIY